ncbi:bacterial regulatory helix-turn-helix, lysR family protein [Bordetella holmesii 30539]|uniref:Bacterial regulatory helix-turn-helix, lysR family protein n=1 Tax=Bordetella holmesii 1058 TaxID=1247648 RepID=A0ABN0S0U2_9BORD|nr:bacterial regulatory helix-turn-helix, lysR family protein [Bordetella holmesii ATCC 51541]AIT25105.1 bacterial regulatory helix-turn-helix, lysR family protein [Bordetella holmesii 44057]EWM45668.1 bacterial regulatory helix-turn-helix, lysR family protein [Bordetella holmesii 70147]EWM48809.1 bacterial regulatory helix-turn-helix, lysR family protein [Bordetella holmesii 41130]EWM49792.1 bacterial regulatory helix-turn-helix, lysR family protein [Bordetella holmesii 35009]EXF87018.1 bacte
MAQPALSQHVAALESELGITLFERRAKGVTLTPAGERLRQRASSILAQLDALKIDVPGPPGKPRGPVRVCLSRSLARVLVAPLLRHVERELPDVRLLLSSALSSEMRTALETRQLDVALMPNAFELPGLDCTPIYEEGFSLFGRASLFERAGKTIAFSAIGSRPLVAPDRDHDLRRLIERTAIDLNCPLNVKYEINDPDLNYALVREGLAFAVLPASAGLDLGKHDRHIEERKVVRPAITRVQSIVRMPGDAQAAASQAVGQALIVVMKDLVKSKLLTGRIIAQP